MSGGRTCYKCQQEGHMARECPNAESGGGCGFSRGGDRGGYSHGGVGGRRRCYNFGNAHHMNFNLQKLSCWNCKLKHSLTAECPFKYCVFCWYQLIPGTIHRCNREWVKNLCNCNSLGDYRKIFHQGIETGWSWKELYQMFLQMRHDAGNSNAVQVPEGEELSEAETPPKKKKAN